MILKVKKLHEKAKLPYRGSEEAAGLDLYTIESFTLKPGERKLVSTGIAVEIPKGYFMLIKDRSGFAVKHGLHCLAGVVDSDYRGEIKVVLINLGNEEVKIEEGERIAQGIILPYLKVEVEEVNELSETKRGSGGFGSTGRK